MATGVSQGETVETWSWFLTKLKECIGDDPNMEIISDRHYAITTAYANVFPTAFHGCCCRHLMINYKFSSDKLKAWYWKTFKAYTVPEFEKSISGIRALRPEAYKKLEGAGFKKWSRAHCPANRYNYMTSNYAESINALTKTVRKVPIMMLIDYYRDLIQRWYFKRRFKVYQVRDNKRFHLVDLAKRECSCRKWQLLGLPCGHVCTLSRCLGMTNCNRWAKAWFSKRTLKGTYQELVYPLADPNLWETPHDLQVVLPSALV
ncbi:transposase, MuDR, MULE transposase domain protein [Tanacetum coccineum]